MSHNIRTEALATRFKMLLIVMYTHQLYGAQHAVKCVLSQTYSFTSPSGVQVKLFNSKYKVNKVIIKKTKINKCNKMLNDITSTFLNSDFDDRQVGRHVLQHTHFSNQVAGSKTERSRSSQIISKYLYQCNITLSAGLKQHME